MAKAIKVSNRFIGLGYKPFIVAEMSGNHNQSLKKALEIVDAAAAAGADALKIQTYTADTMTLNVRSEGFLVKSMNQSWEDVSLYDLYAKAYTPWEWHRAIQDRCNQHNMIFFSSPFDETSVEFLEELDIPIFKIASFENTDIPLIRRIAKTGKPVIASTGMASVSEVEQMVTTLRESGCNEIILLKCTSSYPANPIQTNLSTIPNMRETFKTLVGLSDHTMGIGVAAASVAFGSVLIEKHFTLSRSEGGVDSTFSLEPSEFKSLGIETERAWQGLGAVTYGGSPEEEKSKKYRRSLYAAKDIAEGEIITASSLRCVRPALGLEPKYMDVIVGMRAKAPISKNKPLKWGDLG